jgi:hypothetical protein
MKDSDDTVERGLVSFHLLGDPRIFRQLMNSLDQRLDTEGIALVQARGLDRIVQLK